MPIRAVVFDFFGVISSEIAPVVLPRHMPEAAAIDYKATTVERADLGEISFMDTLIDLSQRTGVPAAQLEAEFRGCVRIDPAVVALLDHLHGRYHVALLSNAMAPFLDEILEEHDLKRRFDTMVISCQEHLTKPDPAIFRLLLQRLALPAADCIFTDDNPINVEAALAVGMQAVRFEGADKLKTDLAALGVS